MTTNKPEVKRYDCTNGGAEYCYGCYTMKEDELGYYVEWEAYEALQAECALLRAAIRRLCNIYVVDDYYDGQMREERLDEAVNRAINAVMETTK